MPRRARRRPWLKRANVVLFLMLVGGAVYEQVGQRRDRKRLPRVGAPVDVGGRTMNIFCSGEGTPAVVLDAGHGEPGYALSDIQKEIAAFTRACWFDRAGYGWSDPGPFPRTSEAMSEDLHALLHRTELPPPYVLAGHSLGGMNARVYTRLYPEDVAGLVLIDAAHEDEPRRAPPFMLGRTAPRYSWRPIWMAAHAARLTGVIRLTTPEGGVSTDPAQSTKDQIVDALRRQPKAIATNADASAPESYAQAERSGTLGDRPLVVLTQGRIPTPHNPTDNDREYAAYLLVWMHEIQPKLAALSSRGRQRIVENSGHRIPDEAPQSVVAAVREVVQQVRAVSAPTARSGT